MDNNETMGTIKDSTDGIPEVKSGLDLNKKIIAVVLIAVMLIFIIYINVSAGKANANNDIDLNSRPLNFNENHAPSLVEDKPNNAQTMAREKGSDNSSTDMTINDDAGTEMANVDPVKLMQFKRFMDEEKQEKINALIQRRKTSTLIVNLATSDLAVAGTNPATKSVQNKTTAIDLGGVENELVHAVHTSKLDSTILEGTIIHATLETAVNSDLPGSMRAVINRTVYSADGMQKLLNPGDRLVMQYTSKLTQGATRIFAMGSRIITANGISINLGSPVASPLGVSGLGSDSVNTHFFARFAEASLLAIISAGTATYDVGAKDELNSAALYREGISSSFSTAANESLQANAGRAPTLYVNQGKEITVFVAKDISFAQVYGNNNGEKA